VSVDVALLNDFAAHGAGDHGSLFEFIVAKRSWSEDEIFFNLLSHPKLPDQTPLLGDKLAEVSCRPLSAHLVSTNEQLFPTAFLRTALATFLGAFSMNALVHLSSAPSLITRSQALYVPFATSRLVPFHAAVKTRKMSSTTKLEEKFAPARRVAGQKQDVWYCEDPRSHVRGSSSHFGNQGQSLMKLPLLPRYSQSVCSEEHSVKDSVANR
jgi:hypothetical protein